MWWSRKANSQRAVAAAVLAAVLALGGCGFHPLYGKANPEVVPEMASIKIKAIEDRIGQELRNKLYTRMNTNGEPAQAKYILETVLKETKENEAIQRTEVATRADLYINADYRLRELGTNKIVISISTRAVASYDIVQNEYSNLVAQQDAERRALEQLANEITTHVSFYFSKGGDKELERGGPSASPPPADYNNQVNPAPYEQAPP